MIIVILIVIFIIIIIVICSFMAAAAFLMSHHKSKGSIPKTTVSFDFPQFHKTFISQQLLIWKPIMWRRRTRQYLTLSSIFAALDLGCSKQTALRRWEGRFWGVIKHLDPSNQLIYCHCRGGPWLAERCYHAVLDKRCVMSVFLLGFHLEGVACVDWVDET